MKKIIAIGGSGFIGTNFIQEIQTGSVEILILDIVPPPILPQHCRYHYFDVRDRFNDYSLLEDADIIYLLASLLGKTCRENKQNGWNTNVTGLQNVLNAVASFEKKPHLVFTSTCMVYDHAIAPPYHEESPLNATDLYERSKMYSEQLISMFCATYNCKAIILRFFTVYGPGPASAAKGHFIPTWIQSASDKNVITVYGSGEQTIDLTHVGDVARAMAGLLQLDWNTITYEIINIATGRETSVNEIAAVFKSVIPDLNLLHVEAPHAFARKKYGNIAKAKQLLGFQPRIEPLDGLASFLQEASREVPAIHISTPHFTWPIIGNEEIEAVVKQLKTGIVSYPACEGIIADFEQAFANFHQSTYAISTNSGTAALHAAFFSLNLPPGSTVIAPAYTHLSTVLPMIHTGLLPVFCDIETDTGNINPLEIEKHITPLTKAIVVTHQYGHICDMEKIMQIAKRHQLYVIEDCSHAHGASRNGKMAGSFGDVACFSLQAHKSVWGGEGGILLTRDKKFADRASLFAHYRQVRPFTLEGSREFAATGYGLKNRLHPLAAALAFAQLKKLPALIERRKAHYAYLLNRIQDIKALTRLRDDEGTDRGGFFRFILRYHPERMNNMPVEEYISLLREEGVATVTAGSLAKPVYQYLFFQNINNGFYPVYFKKFLEDPQYKFEYQNGDFPNADQFSKQTLQFPAFSENAFAIIDQYADAMKKIEANLEKITKHRLAPSML